METRVETAFADGEYAFWLPLPQVVELERITESSILSIEERLRAGMGQDGDGEFAFLGGGGAMVRDILAVIRLGLIGGNGGMVNGTAIEVGPLAAKGLVDAYAYPQRPLAESAVLAWRILSAAIFGVRLKKKADHADEKPSPSEKGS